MLGSTRSEARGEDGLPAWLGRIRKVLGERRSSERR